MEHSLCSQLRQKSQNALSSSPTVDSLDLRQLLASDRILQPLIAESVTFDTLSSSSSDQVPPFSTCKPSRLSIIGLGDHLQMFSGPLSQIQESIISVKPKIVITSPTSPRLKSMFKECLCISKWAECLTGWRAPGHVPWGNTPLQTTISEKWLPEGSLFSPEDFSLALYQARAGHVRVHVPQTERNLHVERVDFDSSSGTLTHAELADIMRELKDLKDFFEGNSQDVSIDQQPEQLTLQVPSLMISNSHCTFPLSLDSCHSFTLQPATNLADRRGRKPPPPLLLKNKTTSPELSYPGIPTAFLGSPSKYSPNFQDVDPTNTSGLRIEDMINNLRLQCSSMALHTPPVDNSWDSGSSSASLIPAIEPVKKPMEAEIVEFNVVSKIGSTPSPDQPNNASSEILDRRLVTAPTGRQKETSLSRVRAANPHRVDTVNKKFQTAKCTRPDTLDKKPEVLSKYTSSPPLLLRSSLAKHPANFRPRSVKSVRFALSPSEYEKDLASLMYDDVCRSSQVSPQSYLYENVPINKNPTPHLNPASDEESSEEITHLMPQNNESWHSSSTTFKVSSGTKTKARIKSIIKPPLRHSMVPDIFYGNTAKVESQDNDRPQRSLQSRGRHSLSRIIKGPIFSSKENKRATLSNAFPTRWDLNEKGTAVRDSVASESIQKKSRMPEPLRNILTRFK